MEKNNRLQDPDVLIAPEDIANAPSSDALIAPKDIKSSENSKGMEGTGPYITVHYTEDFQQYREFIGIDQQRKHSFRNRFLISFVILVAEIILAQILRSDDPILLWFLAVFIFYFGMVQDSISAKAMFQMSHRAADGKQMPMPPVSISFFDHYMVSEEPNLRIEKQYDGINCIYANDLVYAFYESEVRAYVIPVSAIPPERRMDLEMYLVQHTGLMINRVKKSMSTVKRILIGILFGLLAITLLVISTLLSDLGTSIYSDGGFSIELPNRFELQDDPDYDFSAASYDSIIFSYWNDTNEMTLKELAEADAAYETGNTDSLAQLPDGSWYFDYETTGEDGKPAYLFVSVTMDGDVYWNTTFSCDPLDKEYLKLYFIEWAQTINRD